MHLRLGREDQEEAVMEAPEERNAAGTLRFAVREKRRESGELGQA